MTSWFTLDVVADGSEVFFVVVFLKCLGGVFRHRRAAAE